MNVQKKNIGAQGRVKLREKDLLRRGQEKKSQAKLENILNKMKIKHLGKAKLIKYIWKKKTNKWKSNKKKMEIDKKDKINETNCLKKNKIDKFLA